MGYSFDASAVRSAKIHRLHDYWNVKRAAKPLPFRAEIDPTELKPLLPNLMVVDLTDNPFRVRYRLVGTAVVHQSRFDFTGLHLDELVFNDEDNRWQEYYAEVHARRVPLFGKTQVPYGASARLPYEFAILPLTSDGSTVSQCISIEDYSWKLDSIQQEGIPRVEARR